MKMFVVLMLLVLAVPCMSQGITSGTDFLGVPTANVMPVGTMSLTAFSTGPGLPDASDNSEFFKATVGICDGVEVTSTGGLGNVSIDNTTFGVKVKVGDATGDSQWFKPAIFLYGIGDGKTAIPGLALTSYRPGSRLSTSASGWLVDGDWECGAGANYSISDGIRLVGEYSTDNKGAGGFELSHKWLVGRVLKMNGDEWFMEAGASVPLW